jgi:hypothetical protein
LLVPGTADASEGKGLRRATAELRRQLKQNTNLKLVQVNAIIDQAKLVLPRLGELSFGQVVIGVVIGPDGEVTGITGCSDGHSCAGSFQNGPEPGCTKQGSVCHAEACNSQTCDDHWCLENACDAESCEKNGCNSQACDTEACENQGCAENTKTDSEAKMQMSKSSGWGAIRANIDALKANKELDVKVVIVQR